MRKRQVSGSWRGITWKIINAPEEDWILLGRELSQMDAVIALHDGFYLDGTIIRISHGRLAGEWKVIDRMLVSMDNPARTYRHENKEPKYMQRKFAY